MRITLEAKNDLEQIVLDYLDANAPEALVQKINEGKKTLSGCWNYIVEQAGKEKRVGRCAAVADSTVFGWAFHYFEEDSIEEKNSAPAATVSTSKKKSDPAKPKKPQEKGLLQLSLFG
ncbi:MAG: PcfK-like family protein [Clostridia bacterium]|nr:PcfK-like family protein [Clostridia bacterium]